MSYEITGRLIMRGETIQVTEKFKKREFAIETEKEYNGKTHTQKVKMQCTNNQTGMLDGYQRGDEVKVHFDIQGTSYTNKAGKEDIITNLNAWKIEKLQAAAPQPAQQYQQPQSYPPAQPVQQTWQVPAIPQQPKDDLPF